MKTLISVEKEQNSTSIEKMLSLVNKYGLSHVCANREFHNIEYWEDGKKGDDNEEREVLYNFPYIDLHFSFVKDPPNQTWTDVVLFGPHESEIEFYFRGTKERSLKFQNLFEYFLSIAEHGIGLEI